MPHSTKKTDKSPLSILQGHIRAKGSNATARALGISTTYLSDVMCGRRKPGPKILKALGLKRIISYQIAE